MLDSPKSRTEFALYVTAGLAAVNAGLFLFLYRKYRDLSRTVEELKAEGAGQIASLKASITSLQLNQQLRQLEAASTSSDSGEFQDALTTTTTATDLLPTETMGSLTLTTTTDAKDRKALLDQVDELYEEGKYSEIYDRLTKAEIAAKDADLLWRLARTCYQMASPLEQKNPKKKSLLDEGYKHASVAKHLKPDDFYVLKWLAALTGSRTDFLGTKEKIEQGNVFKALLDRCLTMKPEDYALLHMRGRFSFSVASLSWLERKAAATFFASPPEATYEDAIRDFEAVCKLKPEWFDNRLYLAKAYLAKGDKKAAVEQLKQAVKIDDTDEDGEETDAMKEARELLKKHDK